MESPQNEDGRNEDDGRVGKAKAAVRAPANQTNIQNNIIAGAGDQNYMDLITSLATG